MAIITTDMRTNITVAVLKHAFKDQLLDMLRIERELGDKLYAMTYNASDIAAMELLRDRYTGSQSTKISWKVNVAGAKIRIGRASRWDGRDKLAALLPDHEPMRYLVPFGWDSRDTDQTFQADDALGAEIMEYALLGEALGALIDTRQAEIGGVLSETRTDGQLRLRWPEVMPIAEQFIKSEPKVALPMVPLATENDALGLPPKVEEVELETA